MSTPLTPIAVAMLLALLAPQAARAADADKPIFSFSGFGTLGAAHSSERNADFVTNGFKPNGPGRGGSWSGATDSVLAGQVTANPTPQISAILQVISEQNYDNSFTPQVEWANVKYQVTPDFNVRIGRTVLPIFLLSDTRKVAYTYPWVRPPLELYELVPVTHSDGVDASYQLQFGDATNTLQVDWGKGDNRIPHDGGIARTRAALTVSNTIEYGALTARLSYGQANLDLNSFDALFGGFRQFGPEGVAIADRYDARHKPLYFIGVGASYDPGDWFANAEWGHLDSESAIGKRTVWYVSGGYRFGPFTPYLTYARATADNLSDPGLTIASLPPFLAGPAAGLNAGLNSVLSSKPVQSTVSVGARWDFMKNTALKVQFDHTRVGAGSNGALTNIQPGFQPSRFSVLSATVDFIF
jgi:hypothetical protein